MVAAVSETASEVQHLVNYLTGTEVTVIALLAGGTKGTAGNTVDLGGDTKSMANPLFIQVGHKGRLYGFAISKRKQSLNRAIFTSHFIV